MLKKWMKSITPKKDEVIVTRSSRAPEYRNIVDDDVWHWDDVLPGDMIHSPGTFAWKAGEFTDRTSKTKILHLAHGLIIVLAKIDGVPGGMREFDIHPFATDSNTITFVILTRHGALVTIKSLKKT